MEDDLRTHLIENPKLKVNKAINSLIEYVLQLNERLNELNATNDTPNNTPEEEVEEVVLNQPVLRRQTGRQGRHRTEKGVLRDQLASLTVEECAYLLEKLAERRNQQE